MQNLKVKTVKGKDYWVARAQRGGKTYERSLGAVATTKRADAQRKLLAFLMEIESGEVKRRQKSATFNDLWPKMLASIAEVKRWKSAKTEESWRYSFGHYASAAFGEKPVARITREDVLEVLRPLWATKTETAGKLRMRLEMFFNWAEINGHVSGANPALWKGNLELFLPPLSKVRPVEHHEAPTMDELRKAVAYCMSHPSPASGLLLFVIATVTRVSEARYAERGEIDAGTWVMPANRRKDGKAEPHRVPLSTLAKAALMMTSRGKYLFSTTGENPLAIDTARLKLCMIVGRPVTVHGIRSTFRDWAAVNGVDFVAAEKALSHAVGTAVTQAYLREDMLEARRPIMQKWADELIGTHSL